MKLFRILIFVLAFAMMLSLMGCDLDALLGEIEDESSDLGDDILGELDHECDFKLESKTDSTCVTAGVENYKCSCGKTNKVTLELLPHTEEIIPAQAPTDTEPGKTEGKKCSVCGVIIVQPEYVFVGDYSNAEKYDGDYAYNSLLKLNKAEKLTELYKRIDNAADSFHQSSTDATADDKYVIANINYADLGLTSDEAIAVWAAYKTDRPLYYWIAGNIYYTSEQISISVEEDYAKASVRAALNAKIYAGVEDFVEEAYTESKYNTALGFHDLIILAIDYAYESDGNTPEDAAWAHNIIGVFDKGAGVCESYAKTFQLLLNYCEVENIIVSGWANEAHAWNLIKLDDGKWYWCDLTWDDKPEFMWGIKYNYFCVNDTENVGWTDGPFTMDSATFLSAHTPYERVDTGINFNYDLPARSDSKFNSADIMLKDTFSEGAETYAIAGYNSVQLISTTAPGVLNIPESVSYLGKTFTVISVGKMENGTFNTGSIATYKNGQYTEQYDVTEVIIPKSVIVIWDGAFNMDALTKITVNKDNTVFTSLDDVLFTKDLTTIIKYPNAKSGATYTLPEQTVRIAAGAFTTLYSNQGALLLEKIYLGAESVTAGVRNYGYGYENARYFESNPWDTIIAKLSGEKTVYNKDGSVKS